MSGTGARLSGANKVEEALSALRANILDGTWPVNSRIPREPELMELLGVGKSTVREAVSALANLGMLEPIKGVGTFVRSLTPVSSILTQFMSGYSLSEVLVYRRALEIEAVQQATVNRTEAQLERLRAAYEHDLQGSSESLPSPARGETPGSFHHLIFEAAGNPLMTNMFSGVMGAIRVARDSGQIIFGSSHSLRQLDHGRLLEAIERQDVVAAAHAMALHTDRDLVPNCGLEGSGYVFERAEALGAHLEEGV